MTANKHDDATENTASELLGGLIWNRDKSMDWEAGLQKERKIAEVQNTAHICYTHMKATTHFAPQHKENTSER